jgi:predicted glycoside hydrolase/deacetylase ChbG (UPF0249 family)
MSDRTLLVTADDFGIGPGTTRGILDLAARGVVTSTVLLVNSPFAGDAVRQWRAAGRPLELGWHPCLTLDRPLLAPNRVPSLVGTDGRFLPLGRLLKRLVVGRVNADEVEAELRAQLARFVELVGGQPANVNAHHHVHVFRVVGEALARALSDAAPLPFLRRVVEPLRTLLCVPGARPKRAFLTALGRWAARRHAAAGFPGNDALAGITDPPCVRDPAFFVRWLRAARGRTVELCCHPGYPDPALADRDPDSRGRRPRELELLQSPDFHYAARAAGFRLVTAAEVGNPEHVAAEASVSADVHAADRGLSAERPHRGERVHGGVAHR